MRLIITTCIKLGRILFIHSAEHPRFYRICDPSWCRHIGCPQSTVSLPMNASDSPLFPSIKFCINNLQQSGKILPRLSMASYPTTFFFNLNLDKSRNENERSNEQDRTSPSWEFKSKNAVSFFQCVWLITLTESISTNTKYFPWVSECDQCASERRGQSDLLQWQSGHHSRFKSSKWRLSCI